MKKIRTISLGRPLHEGVDWNTYKNLILTGILRRPLHEGVDWNAYRIIFNRIYKKSPSSRGRGLKFLKAFCFYKILQSPSSRGRGLKYLHCRLTWPQSGRPLHEGVDWNRQCQQIRYMGDVALFTRAWIEIPFLNVISSKFKRSPSSRGRGLKSKYYCTEGRFELVALFTRAWIEIFHFHWRKIKLLQSPSSRGRGLKSKYYCTEGRFELGRPLHEGVDWNITKL